MRIPSTSELKQAFEELSRAEKNGIEGIEEWKASRPGPRVAITVSTHGNEPSGYAPYWYLKNIAPDVRPTCGSLTFISNNIKAAEKYFTSTTAEEKRQSRFLDINMNRLPANIFECTNDTRYEIKRAIELYPSYRNIDCALDIHSTSQESDPMILQIKGKIDALIRGMPIPIVIENIGSIQTGIPACSLYGGINASVPIFEIETGSHENPSSYELAIRAALIFLSNTGIIVKPKEIEGLECAVLARRYYRVRTSVFFPDTSYELTGNYPMFSTVKKDEVVATGDGEPILCPIDGHAILAPNQRKPVSIAEEVLFLTDPVEERTAVSAVDTFPAF